MFWDTLERVNRLRQEALNNPEFVQLAREHECELKKQAEGQEFTRKRKVKRSEPKTLADIYHKVEFGEREKVHEH